MLNRAHRVAVVATHPIQYYAPLFRTLTNRGKYEWHVFYGWQGGSAAAAYDPGFRQNVQWDVPLLDGYDYTFVPNASGDPGTHHFGGIWSRQLVPALKAWRPDALLVYGWNYRSHLKVLTHFHRRVPILFRGDSNSVDDISRARRIVRSLVLRWVYRHIDVALYVGRNNKSYYVQHGVDEGRLWWAPHSIDNDRFSVKQSTDQNAAAWRAELGIGALDVVFLYVGKFEAKKAPELLLQTFLRRRRPGEHLVLAGSGELEPHLRELANGDSAVHFIGFQNQSMMPTVYRMGDVFVMPSRGPFETWGLAVNEAMASSRPVIVCDRVGCAADLVEDGETGFTFSRDDNIGLDKAMTALSSDASLRQKMGINAARRISLWTIEEQARRIENAVESIAATHPHVFRPDDKRALAPASIE